MNKLFTGLFLSMLVISCGEASDRFFGGSSSDDGSVGAPVTPSYMTEYDGETTAFNGYVSNAFAVTVDGVSYFDMEEFYTEELARLPEKLAEAGYEGYDFTFEAELGFSDLWHNMTVYLAPEAESGYQGAANVSDSGHFQVQLPLQANGRYYKVRANKRINLVLSRDGERLQFCYNFSAIEKSVLLDDGELPIILDTFSTHLTSYKCAPAITGELSLPENERATVIQLKRGMTKVDVLEALSSEGLIMEGLDKWCWVPDDFNTHPNCSVNYQGPCQCSLSFEDGLLSDQYNFDTSKIDLANW